MGELDSTLGAVLIAGLLAAVYVSLGRSRMDAGDPYIYRNTQASRTYDLANVPVYPDVGVRRPTYAVSGESTLSLSSRSSSNHSQVLFLW